MTVLDRRMLIRADASASIGSGHVTRCLNLADAWKAEGGVVTLCAAEITPVLADRVLAAGVTLERLACERGGGNDAELTRGLASGASVIVVDGYAFDRAFQARMNSGSATILVIDDDPGARGFACDLLLNQNAGADRARYAELVGANCEFLMGPQYALLQARQARTAPLGVVSKEPLSVLVTLGGGSNTEPLCFVIELLAAQKCALNVTVLLGGSDIASVREKLGRLTHQNVVLVSDFVEDLGDKLESADVAIVAGGVTVWEALRAGLPTAILAVADNQVASARHLDGEGVAVLLGEYPGIEVLDVGEKLASILNSREGRERLSRRAIETVDGQGAKRVVAALGRRMVHNL